MTEGGLAEIGLVEVGQGGEFTPLEGYRRGIDVLGTVLGDKKFGEDYGHDHGYDGLWARICSPTPDRRSLVMIEREGRRLIEMGVMIARAPGKSMAEYQASLARKRKQYQDSFEAVLGAIKPVFERERIRGELAMWGLDGVMGGVNDYQLMEVELGHNKRDIAQMIVPREIDQEKLALIVSNMKMTWETIREPGDGKGQIYSLVLWGEKEATRYRAAAYMHKNPRAIVDLGGENILAVVRHETIHAVFAAEEGYMESKDFVEGMAVRLGRAFDWAGDRVNAPVGLPGYRELAARRDGESARSYTDYLDQVTGLESGRAVSEAYYLYGYALADVLLKMPQMRLAMNQARERGKSPYGPLLAIARSLKDANLLRAELVKYEGGRRLVAPNRDLLAHALKENGLNPDEVGRLVGSSWMN